MNPRNSIKEYFKDLEFDEEKHLYFVKGEQMDYSSSGIIKVLTSPKDNLAKNYAKKHGVEEPLVKKEWAKISKKATDHGTQVHEFGEVLDTYSDNHVNSPDLVMEHANIKYHGVVNYERYIRKQGWIPCGAEIRMYLRKELGWDLKLAGTLDRLFYKINPDGTKSYLISDYKTSKEIHNYSFNENLKFPFNDLPANNYGKYVVGQNIYAVMLQQYFDEVEPLSRLVEINIVWLTPFMKKGYKVIDIPLIQPKVSKWLKEFNQKKSVSLPTNWFNI